MSGTEDKPSAVDDNTPIYSAAQVRERISEMQADLKTQVSSFRKPQPYSTENGIKLYMDDFNSYREVVGLPKRVTYQTFVSYLPDKFKRRLRAIKLFNADMEDWDALQPLDSNPFTTNSQSPSENRTRRSSTRDRGIHIRFSGTTSNARRPML